MIDEIASGLKNAIERGFSVESAVESFIKAGYNPEEVREAARLITEGASVILTPNRMPVSQSQNSSSNQKPNQQPNQQPVQPSQKESKPEVRTPISSEMANPNSSYSQFNSQAQKKPRVGKIILIIIIILLLLAGAITSLILYGDKLLSLIK